MPNLFQTLLVPKSEELVATPYRHGGKEAAEQFFEVGIKRALQNITNSSDDSAPAAIYYAFKQSERAQNGMLSTGWASFLQGMFDAGLMIDGTWPMRTEQPHGLRVLSTNALASSIVLVCRKRPADAPITTRAAFLAALKRELPAALQLLQAGNIAPVDLAQASIGPGMGIFTRYSKVLEADDNPMSVKTALQLINAALDDYLSEQESEYDAETRYAITWFETYGMEPGAYGEAETLAKARNVSVSGVRDSGLIESKGGKVRLKKRAELPADWQPEDDATPTVWECAQQLIRVLESDGEGAVAALLAKLGPRADATRDLAYRLYQICERKKWAEEGRAYNGLVVAWPELQKLASAHVAPKVREAAQGALL
jgi:putative DNA methylase